jgi:hypothetical protein
MRTFLLGRKRRPQPGHPLLGISTVAARYPDPANYQRGVTMPSDRADDQLELAAAPELESALRRRELPGRPWLPGAMTSDDVTMRISEATETDAVEQVLASPRPCRGRQQVDHPDRRADAARIRRVQPGCARD